jgi:stage II sporulation protein AA (anti-sigma F factor antagonist)
VEGQNGPDINGTVEIESSHLAGVPLLRLRGELDHDTATKLQEALDTVEESDAGRCIFLDLEHLSYMDSGGVSVFLRLLRKLEARGWVGLIGTDDRIRRLFVITGLASHPHLRFFQGEEEAVCGVKRD